MGDDLTTNKKTLLEQDFDELVDRIGFEPTPQYQWMGMTIDDENSEWSWMDQDTRDPNEILKDHINMLVRECRDPHHDGMVASHYKKQIYEMRCWLEDIYGMLPDFGEEEKKWEKERVFNKLKGPEDV